MAHTSRGKKVDSNDRRAEWEAWHAQAGVVQVHELLLAEAVVADLGRILQVDIGNLEQQLLQGWQVAVGAGQRLAGSPGILSHRPEPAAVRNQVLG